MDESKFISFRGLSSSECDDCDNCCLDNNKCGTKDECNGSNLIYFLIVIGVVLMIGAGFVLWMVYIWHKRKVQRQSLQNNTDGKKKNGKVRKRRGICIGLPIPKNIPVGIAKMKASIELDKRDSLRASFIEAIKNFKPNYPLLFEKNIKKNSLGKFRQSCMTESIVSKSVRSNDGDDNKEKIEYIGPTLKEGQKVETHDFRNSFKRKITKKLSIRAGLEELLDSNDGPIKKDKVKVKHKRKHRKLVKKKKNKDTLATTHDDLEFHRSSGNKMLSSNIDITEDTINPLNQDSINIFDRDEFEATEREKQNPSRVDRLMDDIMSDE